MFVKMRFGLIAGLIAGFAAVAALVAPAAAMATPSIVVDAATGDVLYAEQADTPWYPASLTKLMTFYVALSAVRDHKISLDTPILISARANRAAPSKMGFKPGTELTLGNALKMMVVKSANDLAIAVAEAVSGSVEAFAEDMNATAAQLGMKESHFANPNGLPDPTHVSSAHDLAILSRAIYVNFPQEAEMFSIGALKLGDEIIANHNNLLGRYPGVDGMKTGFTCAAGFNLIASAQREGHRYIAVVLGAPNVKLRMIKTAVLLDRAFDGIDHPQSKLDEMASTGAAGGAPDMHNAVCRRRAKAAAAYNAEIVQLEAPLLSQPAAPATGLNLIPGSAVAMTPVAPTIATLPKPAFDPVAVYLGPAPGYQGPVAQARAAHAPVGTAALVEPAAAAAPEAKPDAKTAEPSEGTEEDAGEAETKTAHAAPTKPAHKLAKAKPDKSKPVKAKLAKTTTKTAKATATNAEKPEALHQPPVVEVKTPAPHGKKLAQKAHVKAAKVQATTQESAQASGAAKVTDAKVKETKPAAAKKLVAKKPLKKHLAHEEPDNKTGAVKTEAAKPDPGTAAAAPAQ